MIFVDGEGRKGSRVAFVGEAPGSEEVSYKPHPRPFVGPAGRELDRQLLRVQISRPDSYVTNVVKHKLKDDDFTVMYKNKPSTEPTEELKECWKRLEEELKEIRPNVIVPLGNYALHAVTGLFGIGKWRGSIVKSRWGTKCVGTYHPSGILRSWDLRPLVLADLRKAKRESWHPLITLPERDLRVAKTLNAVKDYFDAARISKESVSSDIETLRCTWIDCVGFSYSPKHALTVPFIGPNGRYWNPEQEKTILEWFKEFFISVPVMGQNFHYDRSWLKWHFGIDIKHYVFDCWVAHHAAHPELPKGLDVMASLYTDEPYWKDENKDWNRIKDFDIHWQYNGKDCAVAKELEKPLQNEINATGTRETFDFEMSLVPMFVQQTIRGINFDFETRKKLRSEIKGNLKSLEDKLDSLLPGDWKCIKCDGKGEIGKKKIKVCPDCKGKIKHINSGSPKQLSKLVYTDMQLPTKVHKKTGKKTVNEDAIRKLQAKYPTPIFQTVLDIREVEKEAEFLSLTLDSDHRFRTTLACSPETGRLSSSKSPWKTGGNNQNVKRKKAFRDLYIVDDGMVMFGPDYSQAEARVMAYESADPEYMSIFERKLDIHTENARTIFEKWPPTSGCNGICVKCGDFEKCDYTYKLIKKERQLGKRVCHGINYLMGPFTLCDTIINELGPEYAITVSQAKRFREVYFGRFTEVPKLHQKIESDIQTTRTLYNSFGRRRQFFGRPVGKTIRDAVAHIPQSTVADLCNRAIRRVLDAMGAAEDEIVVWGDYGRLRLFEWLLQIHDQLLFQGRDEGTARTTEIADVIKKAMEWEIKAVYSGLGYTIPVDMKVGYKWGSLE